MPDAKVIPILRPRKYRCSFETGSASAVAHVAVIAASFGVKVDIREAEPSDHEEPPAPSPLSDPGSFSGAGVRLDL
jgi:hypothetical protein